MSHADHAPQLLTFFATPGGVSREEADALRRQMGLVTLYPGDIYQDGQLTIKAGSSRARDLMLVGIAFVGGFVAAVGGALAFIASLVMWG